MEISIISGSKTNIKSCRYEQIEEPSKRTEDIGKTFKSLSLMVQRISDNKLFVHKGNDFASSGSSKAIGCLVP